MAGIGWYPNVASVVNYLPGSLPDSTIVEPRWFPTPDGAVTSGLLYRPASPTQLVACVMHPRVDCSHHYVIPGLLRAGIAVWGQRSRWVGNDSDLVHERVLVDIATAHAALAEEGFSRQLLIGNSGGASLYCLYAQQSLLAAADRLTDDASGAKLDLTASMPAPVGLVLLAPHPGQADMLRFAIDPAVVDESDPGLSDPSLDMFEPANGFAAPPASSSYSEQFLEAYRAAQLERLRRIDEVARTALEQQSQQRSSGRAGDAPDRRRAQAARYVVVHRTDADPRFTDLSLDPSQRAYGSLLGRRPDITNFGVVGFARLSTPRAWLSTWSYAQTRAALRLTVPGVDVPALVVGYRGDPCVFPSEVEAVNRALPSASSPVQWIDGDHYGLLDEGADDTPRRAAVDVITGWGEAHG
ncbi:MAG: alpha/beta hydrolase [Ilumatobacteraceae bacterium]